MGATVAVPSSILEWRTRCQPSPETGERVGSISNGAEPSRWSDRPSSECHRKLDDRLRIHESAGIEDDDRYTPCPHGSRSASGDPDPADCPHLDGGDLCLWRRSRFTSEVTTRRRWSDRRRVSATILGAVPRMSAAPPRETTLEHDSPFSRERARAVHATPSRTVRQGVAFRDPSPRGTRCHLR